MKILVTVNAAWNVLNFRRPLIESLISSGHQVSILAPVDDSVPELETLGCRFIPLSMDVQGLNPLRELRLVYRMREHFKSERPDAILSYTIKNNLFGALAARTLNIPFIPNVTGLGTGFLAGNLLQQIVQFLYKIAFKNLKVVFFQNEDDRTFFFERGLVKNQQARLLPGSGIDLNRFDVVPLIDMADAPIFLMIARLIKDKGVLEFVEAARLVKAHNANTRFQILGPLASKNRSVITRSLVQKWHSDGVIEYLGHVPDVRIAIADATCVVLPSYREGAPRTLIEAASMGRPLIATDVPGCRSVVDEGESGYLCNVRSASSLAQACQRFMDLSHTQRCAMGRAGRSKMEREFDQKIVLKSYLNALSDTQY